MLLCNDREDADLRNEVNVLKRALTLYLAHHNKVTAPALVGDEPDLDTIQTEYQIARDALTRVYELEHRLHRDRFAHDYDPTDVDLEDVVRNSSITDDITPMNCVQLHRSHVSTIERILEDEPVDDTDYTRSLIDVKHALGNDSEADLLRDELAGEAMP